MTIRNASDCCFDQLPNSYSIFIRVHDNSISGLEISEDVNNKLCVDV
jgi:hypothetical protein